jgi:ABC-2 type transport system ATP-binding protein
LIEAVNLSKFYGPTRAVENVSFKVEKGDILGLLGPNGAGKTTIMRMLTCYFQPTGGKASVAGFDIVEQSNDVKKRIGYLPEILPLYQEMIVESYLYFIAELKGIPKPLRKTKVNKALEQTETADVKNRIVGRLSRGYKQRVGLAQALLHDPEVLILDEPTIGMDPKQIIEIRELIKGLGGERTIILSSHILPEVSMTCNKAVIIDRGTVVAAETIEGLTQRIKGSDRLIVKIKGDGAKAESEIGRINGVSSIKKDKEGSLSVLSIDSAKDIREDVFKIIVANNLIMFEMKKQEMSLEDIFLNLTMKEEGV